MTKRSMAGLFLSLLGMALSAQKVELNAGIAQTAMTIAQSLPGDTKIAVVDVVADTNMLSDYILEELARQLSIGGKLAIIERGDLETALKTQEMRVADASSDESAQTVGRMVGAESIAFGSMALEGNDTYRLRIKVVSVGTAEVQCISSILIARTDLTDELLGNKTRSTEVMELTTKVATKTVNKAFDFTGRFLTAVINPIFGIGSYLQGDLFGGLTVTCLQLAAGTAVELGLNETSGLPIFLYVASLAFSVVRPFFYQKPEEPQLAMAKDGLGIALLSGNAVQLTYAVRL